MPKQAWNIFVGFMVLAVIAFLGFTAWQYRSQYDLKLAEVDEVHGLTDKLEKELEESESTLKELEKELEETKQDLSDQTVTVNELKGQATNLKSENLKLVQEKVEMNRIKGDLERSMKEALTSKDVAISELKGKLTVDILNRVLFDLGRTELREEGKKVLLEVAGVLERYPKRQIHVIGHTDNIPFSSASGRYRNNWELSSGRATAAVTFLQKNAGVNPKRLAIVGYGEYHPVATNKSPEGRAKNRRITIVIMPEDLSLAPEPFIEEDTAPDAFAAAPDAAPVTTTTTNTVEAAPAPTPTPAPKKPIATGIKPISKPISTTNE